MKVSPLYLKELSDKLYSHIGDIMEGFYTEDGDELIDFEDYPINKLLELRTELEGGIRVVDEVINEIEGK